MSKWTEGQWQYSVELPQLLDRMPLLIEALGFRFYAFTFISPCRRNTVTNYPIRWIEHYDRHGYAAVDPVPLHCRTSCFPLLWRAQIFGNAPDIWTEAQVCGLRHGWVQPIHDQQAHSNLSVLRSHVSVSTEEFYEKAHYVMQLAEQLHSALRCADSTSRRLSQQR